MLLLDSHTLLWWSSGADRLSGRAVRAIAASNDLAVSGITWFELALLARRGRVQAPMPVRRWLEELSRRVHTLSITPAIAETAAALPSSFPADPTDRIIYATAIEHGCRLVTKDERMHTHAPNRKLLIW